MVSMKQQFFLPENILNCLKKWIWMPIFWDISSDSKYSDTPFEVWKMGVVELKSLKKYNE
jgi:hypothetical protein